ncbi:hypothetical protein [Streptomyces decoyicus]|uniref:hypothetical protein n=1 Tax=Streptomyces decoyicus TaxID=249567 RepID=UPI0033A4AD70
MPHGITTEGASHTYTDVDHDLLTITPIDDNNGHPAVALNMQAGGDLVHIDADHVEDVVAALRRAALEARSQYGQSPAGDRPPTVQERLTEMLAEGGHGDNAELYAAELLGDHRAELSAAVQSA